MLWLVVAAILLFAVCKLHRLKMDTARQLRVSSGNGIAATIASAVPSLLRNAERRSDWNEYLPTHDPPWWAIYLGGTLSTIVDTTLRWYGSVQVQYRRELVVLDDGGTVAADWVSSCCTRVAAVP